MKRTLLIATLLILCYSSKAQHQSIFGENNTSWNFWPVPIGASYTDSLFTGKDTLIYGKLYKVVHINAPNVTSNIIREDTSSGSIFLSDYFHGGNEIEIMNMNLTVDDSFCFEVISVDSCNASTWKKVDSVYFQNGKKIIQFDHWLPSSWIPGGSISVKWKFIEGIGPNNQGGSGSSFGVLLCSYKDGKKVYTNEAGASCVVNTFSVFEKSKTYLNIYPNPVTHSIQIESLEQDVNYLLTTIQGIRIQEGSTSNKKINMENIKPGIYILSLFYQDQIIQTKIIKE